MQANEKYCRLKQETDGQEGFHCFPSRQKLLLQTSACAESCWLAAGKLKSWQIKAVALQQSASDGSRKCSAGLKVCYRPRELLL